VRTGWLMMVVGLAVGCGEPGAQGGAAGGAVGNGAGAADMGVGGSSGGSGSGGSGGAGWRPAPGVSWQWEIGDAVDTSVDVALYDIDLFDTPVSVIAGLQARGRKVICYFDTQYEPNRPDSARFTSDVLGNGIVGWPGQRWVDIRSPVVHDIMNARLDLAAQKRCDGVEPDDVDGYTNDPGFPLTAADQLAFNRFVAAGAHQRGLAVALKNDLDQVGDLVGDFDFALNEECFAFDECALLRPFTDAGKAVLQVEYGDDTLAATVCPMAKALRFDTLIKRKSLDAWRVACSP
jgi:hypothetical protein